MRPGGAKNQPTAIDLFCGAGGLSLGLKQAGFLVLAGVESEEVPANTYRRNHPDSHCFQKDIRELGAAEILTTMRLRRGQLDLLAGCPPCQGYSTLRTRKKSVAVSDERNDLLFEFLRMVKVLSPRAIMMENVPALAADERMDRFITSLRDIGYQAGRENVRIVDAAEYGVPQRRLRMIFMTTKSGWVSVAERSETQTVRQCLNRAGLAPVGESGDPLHDYRPNRTKRVRDIIKNIPKDGGSRSSLPDHLVLRCHKGNYPGFKDVYGRMSWDKVAPTMTGGCGNPSKGRYLHPDEDRAISLREAAMFQTFPAGYEFDLSKGRDKAALMIGNALPPELIRRHAIPLADLIRKEK